MEEIKINSIDELNNLEIKKKEIEIENEYLGCCSKTDKRLINFIVQLLLALLTGLTGGFPQLLLLLLLLLRF